MPDSGDHVEQVEAAKLIFDALRTARAGLEQAHGCTAIEYGASVHGHSVNEPLAALYRELDEGLRAVDNAVNALQVLRSGTPAPADALPARTLGPSPPPRHEP